MIWLVGIILAGFLIRVVGLGDDSLWYDEGGSIYFATQPLANIVPNALTDAHPPLYFVLLHGWLTVAGTSEYATRFWSVWDSVACIAVLYALGCRIHDRTLGLFGAGVWALSPFAVLYAREARMYSLVALFAAVATYVLLRRGALALAYGAAVTALLYTHYFGVLLAGGHAAILLVTRRWSFAVAGVVAGALWLPWLWAARGHVRGYTGVERDVAGLPKMLWSTLVAFSSGYSPERLAERQVDDVALLWLLPLATLALALLGLRTPIVAAWLLGTFAMLGLIVVARMDYTPRYLMVAAPAFALAVAAGAMALGRARTAAVALLAVGMAYALWRQHADARLWHEDFRAAVAHVAADERPGQVVVLEAGYMRPVYDYYAANRWNTIAMPPRDDALKILQLESRSWLPFVWVILWQDYYSDPSGATTRWLESRGTRVDDRRFRGDIRLVGYELTRWP